MGDPGKQEKIVPKTVSMDSLSKNFKSGEILKGIPEHGDNSWPKNGRIAKDFKWQRDSKIGRGSI